MRKDNEQTLGDAIKFMISKLGLTEKLLSVEAEEVFEQMMGGPIMKYVEDIRVENGVLFVRMNSPELKNELQYGKSKIIQHINEEMKSEFIVDVKFL